jgi:NhaP-type Na+/H+ or K+/H+ antiporter
VGNAEAPHGRVVLSSARVGGRGNGYGARIELDTYELVLAVGGAVALAAAWLPRLLQRRPVSLPMFLVGLGVVLFLLPTRLPDPDPTHALTVTEHITEVGVIVSLMGAGLKIDRTISWAGWRTTRRLLLIAMPVTILGVAVLGWWVLGLGAAGAVLLGSVLAPTDPVVAADVQVGEPTVGDEGREDDEEDEVRFSLTSEAGLNDALAFPFVYLAIRLAEDGTAPSEWLAPWLGFDVVYRLVAGVTMGYLIGRLLAYVLFRGIGSTGALADAAQGFVAIAATLLAYGGTELVQGYGFLAVFVTAITMRASERRHQYHQVLHDFSEQAEQLLIVGLLVLFGGALVGGLFAGLSWPAAAMALLTLLVVRPVAAWLSLAGCGVERRERRAIAFFGVRGVGSFYYLAYAASEVEFEQAQLLWSTVSLTVVLSIVLHGVTASPAMERLDQRRYRRRLPTWRGPRSARAPGIPGRPRRRPVP